MSFKQLISHFRSNIHKRSWIHIIGKTCYRAYTENIFTRASSLTFSSIISLVPLITVVLSVFSVLPAFERMQSMLEQWLLHNLIPEDIGQQVLEYTNQFAAQASSLGIISGIFLFLSSILLIASVEEAFNQIWHTRIYRSIEQRLVMYWSSITLFPIIMAIGVTITSSMVYLSNQLLTDVQQDLISLAKISEFILLMLASTIMYYFLPEAHVRFKHALIGGTIAALIITIAKKIWVIYYALVPTYSLVYGTFVIIPLLLLWIYVLWLIILLVAVFVSLLPDLSNNPKTILHGTKGWKFKLACNVLAYLNQSEKSENKTCSITNIAKALNSEEVYVRHTIKQFVKLKLVGKLDTDSKSENYVLLANLEQTPALPLINLFLLNQTKEPDKFLQACQIEKLTLAQII